MEDTTVFRRPEAMETHEVDLQTVHVILDIENLQTGKTKKEPSNAKVEYTFGDRSFQVTAEVDKKDGTKANYKQVIRKLPGPIDRDNCQVKFDRGKIILILKKSIDCSWDIALKKNMLEQDIEDD